MMPPIPEFIRTTFDADTLEADRALLVAIDANAIVLWTNSVWRDFALANGGSNDVANRPIGLDYLGPLPEPFSSYYRNAFATSLAAEQPFEHEYECSTADVFRRFRLRALPVQSRGLLLEHSIVASAPHDREPQPALLSRYEHAHGITMCGNCRRTKRNDASQAWDWVPAWVSQVPARTSHAICAMCAAFYYNFKTA